MSTRQSFQFTPDSTAREAIMGKANSYGDCLVLFYTAGHDTVKRCEKNSQRATNALRKEIDRQIKDAYMRGCVEATERRAA